MFEPAVSRIGPDGREAEATSAFSELKYKLLQRLLMELDPAKVHSRGPARARETIEEAANQVMMTDGVALPRPLRSRLVQELLDEILGYGPLEPLLNDPTVSEIMVNSADEVYVEREGVLTD